MVEPVRDAGRPDPDGFAERIHFRWQNPCNRWQQPILTDVRVSISSAYFCQIPFCDVKTGFGKVFRKWPAYFRELGYETAAFGKVSHYKHTVEYGFDHFAHDTFHDHAGIQAAADFLRSRRAAADSAAMKPLCLMIGSNWPHVPWPELKAGEFVADSAVTLPAGSIDTAQTRHWRQRYLAAVRKLDEDLGLIVRAVREHLPGAIVVFSADHGAQWPLAKWNLYDAGIRTPLIVAWPGKITPGRTSALVSWIDLLPTLVELARGAGAAAAGRAVVCSGAAAVAGSASGGHFCGACE